MVWRGREGREGEEEREREGERGGGDREKNKKGVVELSNYTI